MKSQPHPLPSPCPLSVQPRPASPARRLALLAAAGVLALPVPGAGLAVAADAFPQKPVRIIVPFPPGGGTDFVTRVIQQPLSDLLGQSVLIDNRGGAQGVVGTQIGARSANDGYTLVIAEIGATAIAPAMSPKPPFDPIRDFVPIGMLVEQPYLMSIHPSVPAKTLADFVKLVQANPGKYNFGSGNATAHVAQEVFYSTAKLKMTHIPYRGSGPSMAALLANEVQVIFSGPTAAIPQIKAGKVRPLGVTSPKRSGELPDVPTMGEQGYKGFEIRGWYGLMAPAGTPRPVVMRLNEAVNKVLSGGPAAQTLKDRGFDPAPMSPEDFGKYLRAEVARWAKAVKQYEVKSTD
jgi:tripartite-type tricarboxylate transporter receptor subunit TctC